VGPIVFISHFKVREGKLEGFEDLSRAIQTALEEEKPRTVAYLFYLNDDRSELTIVHLFPDADAMDVHSEGADERAAAAYEFVEPAGWEIYGRPSPSAWADSSASNKRPRARTTLSSGRV
jgi:quinol monooxygenase YgiN